MRDSQLPGSGSAKKKKGYGKKEARKKIKRGKGGNKKKRGVWRMGKIWPTTENHDLAF